MAKKNKWIAVKWVPTLKGAKAYTMKNKGTFKAMRAGGGWGIWKERKK